MRKQQQTLWVGIFASGFVVLLVAVFYFLGSTKLFIRGEKFILYFNESVNGLDVGSPVKLKGVTIGSVNQILIDPQPGTSANLIPIVIEVIPARLVGIDGRVLRLSDPDVLKQQIDYGLRGKLQQLSFITGQIYIELDYVRILPGPPAFHHNREPVIPEIPTTPSALAEISEVLIDLRDGLGSIDFKHIQEVIVSVLDNLNKNLEGDRIGNAFQEVTGLAAEVRGVLESAEFKSLVSDIGPAVNSFRGLSENLNSRVEPLSDSVDKLMSQMSEILNRIDKVMEQVESVAQPESEVGNNLNDTLQSLSQAAASLSRFLEFLDRNPDSLIKGRAN